MLVQNQHWRLLPVTTNIWASLYIPCTWKDWTGPLLLQLMWRSSFQQPSFECKTMVPCFQLVVPDSKPEYFSSPMISRRAIVLSDTICLKRITTVPVNIIMTIKKLYFTSTFYYLSNSCVPIVERRGNHQLCYFI